MPEKSKVKVNVKKDSLSEETVETEDAVDATDTVAEDADNDLEKRLEESETEAKMAHDRFLRVSAEFENYKKRAQREVDDFRKYANEAILKDLLTVVDNLERAVESSSEKCENGTLKEILKVFEKFSVKPIEALEHEFDPAVHQAVLQEASEAHAENMVIREFQKGYTIHDRLLRPAMVVVSKSAGNPGEGTGTEN